MQVKVLITGGAGYLGSILTPFLLRKGYQVTVLDNLMFKQTSLAECFIDQNFRFILGDIRDTALISEEVKKADVVIPLAALVGAPICNKDPFSSETVNLEAQISIIDAMSPTQKLLIPITNSGYGIGEKDKFCTEDSPLNPISIYGKHKVIVEKHALERENTISFRLATVFGLSPRMRLDLLVNDFVFRALNDKAITLFESEFKRNYIHIRDIANLFLFGIQNFEKMRGNCFNAGLSDANLSKRELCDEIKKIIPDFVYNISEIGEDLDKRDYIVSNEKLESFGFKTQVSLYQGICELEQGLRIFSNNSYKNT